MRPACVGHLSAAPKLFFQVARGPSVPRAFRAPRRFRPARRPLCACGAGLPCEGRAVRATLTRASTVPNFSRFLREKSHQRAILCAHRWCALRTIDKRARCPPSGRWLGATRGACHKGSQKSRQPPAAALRGLDFRPPLRRAAGCVAASFAAKAAAT